MPPTSWTSKGIMSHFKRMSAHGDLLAAQAAAGVFDHGVGLGQNLVEAQGQFLVVLDLGQFGLPGRGFLAQRLVGQRLQGGLEFVDLSNLGPHLLDLPFVLRTDDFLDDEIHHTSRTLEPTGIPPCRQKHKCRPGAGRRPIPPPIIPLPKPFSRPATSRKSSNNRVIPPPWHTGASLFLRLLLAAPKPGDGGRLFAAKPVHGRSPLHTLHFAFPRHFLPARPLFLINFNLHARHFTNPGWTNTVQVKLFCP